MLRYGAGDAGDALRASYGTGNPAAEPGSMTHYELIIVSTHDKRSRKVPFHSYTLFLPSDIKREQKPRQQDHASEEKRRK